VLLFLSYGFTFSLPETTAAPFAWALYHQSAVTASVRNAVKGILWAGRGTIPVNELA